MQNVVLGLSFNVERGRKVLVSYSKSSKGTVYLTLSQLFFLMCLFRAFQLGLVQVN